MEFKIRCKYQGCSNLILVPSSNFANRKFCSDCKTKREKDLQKIKNAKRPTIRENFFCVICGNVLVKYQKKFCSYLCWLESLRKKRKK